MITRNPALPLTPALLQGCLNEHLRRVPAMERLRAVYTQHGDITRRQRAEGLPNNRLSHAFARYIVTLASSYLVGTAVTYGGDTDGLRPLLRAYQTANTAGTDVELARQAALYGRGVEIIYADGHARPRSAALDPRTAFAVYSDDVSSEPLFGVHYRPVCRADGAQECFEAQVWTASECRTYRADTLSRLFLPEPVSVSAHYFGSVPLVEYWNNEEETGDLDSVLSLIEAYDVLESDRVNDMEQLTDSLLLVWGARMETDERGRTPAQQLRQDKLLYLPDREAGAQYLSRPVSGSDAETLRRALESDIHKFSMVPDLSDECFSGNVSGVAIRYKLLGLEQLTRNKERWFREGLTQRLRCYLSFLALKGMRPVRPETVTMTFNRTLPQNVLETAQMVRELSGIVPREMLLSQLPFTDGAVPGQLSESDSVTKE